MPNDTVLRFDCRPEHMHDPPLRKFRHMRAEPMFATYLDRWALTPDGAPIATHSSDLLPVRHDGVPALLKIARGAEEKWGGGRMVWWAGDGAARGKMGRAAWGEGGWQDEETWG